MFSWPDRWRRLCAKQVHLQTCLSLHTLSPLRAIHRSFSPLGAFTLLTSYLHHTVTCRSATDQLPRDALNSALLTPLEEVLSALTRLTVRLRGGGVTAAAGGEQWLICTRATCFSRLSVRFFKFTRLNILTVVGNTLQQDVFPLLCANPSVQDLPIPSPCPFL